MPVATPLSVILDDIIRVIKRFKFDELENAVLPIFPEISWVTVKTNLVKNHTTFTTTNACKFIKKAIIDARITSRELKDRLLELEVIDVGHHNRKKVWHGYKFINPTTKVQHLAKQEIEDNIIQYFESVNMNMNVKMHVHSGITYVHLKKEKRQKKDVRTLGVFFALFLGQKYFFCSKKDVGSDFVDAITTTMGYGKCKKLKLMGRDLISLSTLCWNKKQGALNSENIEGPPEYEDAPPTFNNTGIDFTQQKQRRKFAEKCFGKDTPTLELVVINGPDQPWDNEVMASMLPDEKVHMTWEFRSRNIAAHLTNLIERRILVPPIPNYISNLTVLGKNEINLRND